MPSTSSSSSRSTGSKSRGTGSNSKKAAGSKKSSAKKSGGKAKKAAFDIDEMMAAYRLMATSRALDKKMLVMLKQGKSFFHIGCMGHEAAQAAMADALTKKVDWAYPYYRGQTLSMGMGMTAKECLLSFLAKADDPNSGGRQMPQHYGHKEWNIPSQSSPTGTQFLQAVGCSDANRRLLDAERMAKGTNGKTIDDGYPVTVVTAGDGTTSQGDFHEALNWATREKLPTIFLIEDNGYAISVPVRDQTPGGKVAHLGRGYEGLNVVEVDGCDYEASRKVMEDAVARARAGDGPSMIVADVIRLLPHSSSDDQRKYRDADELDEDKARDPIPALRQRLIALGAATEEDFDAIDAEVKKAVDDAAVEAEGHANPERSTALDWVFSDTPEPAYVEPKDLGEPTVLVDAINRALSEEMARDERVLVFGEDVAGEKGGVFTATRGLTKKFGKDRCFNSPLAESSIVGVAIGQAMRGYKPVPEIQFGDYVWTAMMQIRNELSTMRYRSNNAFSCPAVIRIPIGGYIHGALCHSQNIESFFTHIPGLKVALPSNALDAYGLLKAAIRGDDPVLFLEHKGMYRQNYAKSQLPKGDDWVLPFGKAAVRREGSDITVVTYGAMVQRCLQSANTLADEGIDVEVVDLRTLNPVDWETVFASVRKTNKAIVIHEDCRFVGYGAEIAAEISEQCFADLDGPVRRLAGADSPVPFNWDLEEEVLPQLHHVRDAIRDLANY